MSCTAAGHRGQAEALVVFNSFNHQHDFTLSPVAPCGTAVIAWKMTLAVILFKLSRPEGGNCDGATLGVGGLSFMRTKTWMGLKTGNSLRRSWNTNAVMKHPDAADRAAGSDRSADISRTFPSAVLSLLLEKLRSASTHCWQKKLQLFYNAGTLQVPISPCWMSGAFGAAPPAGWELFCRHRKIREFSGSAVEDGEADAEPRPTSNASSWRGDS